MVNTHFSITEIQFTDFMFDVIIVGIFFSRQNEKAWNSFQIVKNKHTQSLETSVVYLLFLLFKIKCLENSIYKLAQTLGWIIRKSDLCGSK